MEVRLEDGGTQTVTDCLGPDGTERTGLYPVVCVTYLHDGVAVAHASYTLRPGSAVERREDIVQFTDPEAERLTAELLALEAAGADAAFASVNRIELEELRHLAMGSG